MVFLNQPNYMSMKLESQCFCMFARSKNRSIYGFEVYEHKQRFITRFMSLPMYTTNGTQFIQWWKIKALLFRQMEFSLNLRTNGILFKPWWTTSQTSTMTIKCLSKGTMNLKSTALVVISLSWCLILHRQIHHHSTVYRTLIWVLFILVHIL